MIFSKKRRILGRTVSVMDADVDSAKAKLAAVAEELGREIHVFINSASSPKPEQVSSAPEDEPDDFYDFTPEDYYRLMGDKIGAQSQVLKTRKLREAEAAARRARITKAVVRVRFPDNFVLETKFKPSDKIQDLVDLLQKVLVRPDLPFYLYTTPPKERIKDMSMDFYTAGFAPGAIVYFSYNLPAGEGDDTAASTMDYLRDDIRALNGLDATCKQLNIESPESRSAADESSSDVPIIHVAPEPKPEVKKPAKPKWLKL